MSKSHIYRVNVQFGDCDPAGIVFFPNFSKWMDTASLAFFMACGVPPWRELVKTAASSARRCWRSTPGSSRNPPPTARRMEVHTTVESWAAKTFRHRHVIKRGDTLMCEGTEVRAFCVRDADNPDRIKRHPGSRRHQGPVH
jgi:4-hydroxybenzoyl-CoA thioesterase